MKLKEATQPTTLWRIIPKEYISDVQTNGLKPSTGTDKWSGKEIKYSKPSVFLFGDMQCSFWHTVRILMNQMERPGWTHEDWTNEDWANAMNSLAVLEVDVTNIPVEYKGLQDEIEEWVAYEHIPPENIRVLGIDIESYWNEMMRVC